MAELHVWGSDGETSIISPECTAVYYVASLVEDDSLKVVSSSNTNLSKSGKLPVLVTEGEVIEGYEEIVDYICHNYKVSSELLPLKDLSASLQLVNKSLIHFLSTKVHYINQYNLYVNTRNYEEHVRKLFKNYLPFPMMYNQPLKYYNTAKEQVKLIGIGENQRKFLSFGADPEDNDDFDDTKPISKLHEKQLLLKNKEKMSIRESRNTMRAMNLFDEYLTKYEMIVETTDSLPAEPEAEPEAQEPEKHSNSEFRLLCPGKLTTSDILLVAYFRSLTSTLPDQNLSNVFASHSTIYQWLTATKSHFDELTAHTIIQPPTGDQIPNLFNEIKFQINNGVSFLQNR